MSSPEFTGESLDALDGAADSVHDSSETESESWLVLPLGDAFAGYGVSSETEMESWVELPVGAFARASASRRAGLPPLKRLTVLVPTLNEEAGIVNVLSDIPFRSLKKNGYHASTLVVDGNSTDKTRDLALAMGAEVFVQSRKGKGSALREVIPTIEGEYAVMIDGDGTYSSSNILDALRCLESGADIVSGSRLSGWMETGAMSSSHQWGNRALTGLANVLYPAAKTSDLCTGFWAFRVEALKQLDLTAEGFELEADLLAETALQGFRFAEVPISYGRRRGVSKLTWKHGARIALTLLKKRALRIAGLVRRSAPSAHRSGSSGRVQVDAGPGIQ